VKRSFDHASAESIFGCTTIDRPRPQVDPVPADRVLDDERLPDLGRPHQHDRRKPSCGASPITSIGSR
jgi:hypothetical protein